MSIQQHVVLLVVHLKFGGCVEFATLVTEDLEDGAHREFQVSTDSFDPNSVRHSGILGSIWVIALCLSVLRAFVRLKTSNSGWKVWRWRVQRKRSKFIRCQGLRSKAWSFFKTRLADNWFWNLDLLWVFTQAFLKPSSVWHKKTRNFVVDFFCQNSEMSGTCFLKKICNCIINIDVGKFTSLPSATSWQVYPRCCFCLDSLQVFHKTQDLFQLDSLCVSQKKISFRRKTLWWQVRKIKAAGAAGAIGTFCGDCKVISRFFRLWMHGWIWYVEVCRPGRVIPKVKSDIFYLQKPHRRCRTTKKQGSLPKKDIVRARPVSEPIAIS